MGGSGLTRVSVDCSPKLRYDKHHCGHLHMYISPIQIFYFSRQVQSVIDSGAQSNKTSIEQRTSSVPRNIPGQIV